jgi:hypothetical protein
MKQIAVAIMAVLVLSIGAIMTVPAQALECTEVAGGQISCLLDSGTITVEKLQDSTVSVEEKPNQVTVSVGVDATPVAGNETVVEEPVVEGPTEEMVVDEPVVEGPAEEQMVVPEPEEPVKEDEMVVN